MSRILLLNTARIATPNYPCLGQAVRRYSYPYPRLTGQPTFKKDPSGEDSIAPILGAFAAAFIITVGGLYVSSANKGTSYELRPIHYGTFDVLEARRASSPNRIDVGDNEHVYLKVRAPLGKEAIWMTSQLSRSTDLKILSIYMKEPSLQIERPYTPLYAEAIDGSQRNASVELLIKKYPDGELGKYAHGLHEKATVELRGPDVTWQGPRVDHFVMIVGGTGITPVYQLLNTLLSQSSRLGKSMPRCTLLYGSSKPMSLLLLPELSQLQKEFPQQISVQVYVDQLDTHVKQNMSWKDWIMSRPPLLEEIPIREGRIDEKTIKQALESDNKDETRQVLVCGPDGMVSYIAGPKQGKFQGQLGGILASLGCTQDEVWKL